MTDVTAASQLSAFLRGKGKDNYVRAARATSFSDLRSSPSVLLGLNNEWIIRLGADLHFRFHKESNVGLRWIEDTSNPGNKNWRVDLSETYEQFNCDYALISRILDRTIGRWIISMAGLTDLGTVTASEMTTDPKLMAALLLALPRGWERKNLQIVLAVKVIEGNPGVPQVVGMYSW